MSLEKCGSKGKLKIWETRTENQGWRCRPSVQMWQQWKPQAQAQTHWRIHRLWQRLFPLPASCAKTPASLAKRGSHKKPITLLTALWPSIISVLPYSLLFLASVHLLFCPLITPAPLLFPPSITALSVGISPLFLPDPTFSFHTHLKSRQAQ